MTPLLWAALVVGLILVLSSALYLALALILHAIRPPGDDY